MNEPIAFIITISIFIGIILVYKHYADKQAAKDLTAFKAKVALNPELYYVSQGGLIPDPIPEPEPAPEPTSSE